MWPVVPSGAISVMPQAWTMRQAVALLERFDQRARHGGAADVHRADAREVELAGVGVEVLQHAHPDRRHAAGDRDALALKEIDDAGGVEVRARHHHLRADHRRGERHAPGVGVEHRHDRHHRVALAEAHAVDLSSRPSVCSTSARCEYSTPFGLPVVPGRVAHRGGGAARRDRADRARAASSRSALRSPDSRRPPASSRRRR